VTLEVRSAVVEFPELRIEGDAELGIPILEMVSTTA
jgi:hypothetical protein